MKIFGSITELVAAVFRKNGQAITLRPNQTTTYTGARDVQLAPGDASQILVSEDGTQTLTNKTLTSPAINTPTGITKADVGLGNVDNTSDATKNAAAVTLTNKTLTAPVINSPTGIVKADVGLGNVDNTSDATKNAATATLTNKTLQEAVVDNWLEMNEETTPAAPAAGKVRVYPKNDHKLYVLDENSVETPIGSGSGQGEINYAPNPSAASAITGWVASGAGITVARTTTGALLPRESLTPSAILITGVSGSTDYVRTRFTIGDADKGKMLKIQWAQKDLAGYAAGDLAVEMWTNSASNYGGSYTQLNVRQEEIPAGDNVFLTTFASTTADYYELRIRITGGSTGALALCDVVIGPGALASVPAAQDWQSYTPVFGAGWGTPTGVSFRYARQGDTLLVQGKFVAGTTTSGSSSIGLPSGLTTKTVDTMVVGLLQNNVSADAYRTLLGFINGDNVVLGRSYTATSIFTTLSPDNIDTGNFEVSVQFILPVNEWSQNVFSAQNAVEYVYNSSLTDADDTTSFATGIGGGQFGAFTALRSKRVRFSQPILPSDKLTIQVSYDAGVVWFDLDNNGTVSPFSQPAGTSYGMTLSPVNNTDVDIVFGRYRNGQAATYGGPAGGWTDIDNDPNSVWRLVKSSNPLAIGHDLVGQNQAGLVQSAGQLQGTNTNDAPEAGKVGEYITSYIAEGSAISVPNAAGTSITSISLTPGDWEISFIGQIKGSQGAGVSNVTMGLNQTPGSTPSVGDDSLRDVLPQGTYSKSGSLTRKVSVVAGSVDTYHLNMLQDTGTTWTGWGRISARRAR